MIRSRSWLAKDGDAFTQKRVELPYAQAIHLGDARVTLYPAWHILGRGGSVFIEHDGARIVIPGAPANELSTDHAPI